MQKYSKDQSPYNFILKQDEQCEAREKPITSIKDDLFW